METENMYSLNCGCEFPIDDAKLAKGGRSLEQTLDLGLVPPLRFDIHEINMDCKAVWKMLAAGLTKGIFQLESQLGRQWTKNLMPDRMEELSALGAILRPGCMEAVDETYNCSVTELYCKRKNKEMEVEYKYPLLIPVLESTFGCMIYQEQAMQIAQIVAGFNLQEADMLRKAIGKKLPEEMAKVKKMFMAKALERGIFSQEAIDEIFGWIEKSQRYSFNKSHSYSYGVNGYWSAFIKAHFPRAFFTSWLRHAKEKQKPLIEINELANEAKLMDIYLNIPDIRTLDIDFKSVDKNNIRFGIGNVKGVGESQRAKIVNIINEKAAERGLNIKTMNWYQYLVYISSHISSTVNKNLISVGAMQTLDANITRAKKNEELKQWMKLTEKEQEFIVDIAETCDNLADAVKLCAKTKKNGGGCHKQARADLVEDIYKCLKNPPSVLSDSPNRVAWDEEKLLGTPITYAKVDSYDNNEANCTCKEFLEGRKGELILGGCVERIKEVKVKNGNNAGKTMAYLTISDGTAMLSDVCIFSNHFEKYNNLLVVGECLLFYGKRDAKKGGLNVEKIEAMN